jgi:uncharacterized protein (DUF2235 family)
MGKRIIFCADGTWDDSAKNTNVYKFFKALPITAEQMAFYDDGVGANGLPLNKLAGGAFGTGLYQKIKDGYTKIAHVYEKGDQVFLVGFSRGAYTARCLAGMIAVCGLPTANFTDDMVNQAFQAYRDKINRARILAGLTTTYNLFNAGIAMVGVWDTVGSLGIPAWIRWSTGFSIQASIRTCSMRIMHSRPMNGGSSFPRPCGKIRRRGRRWNRFGSAACIATWAAVIPTIRMARHCPI